jgi:uncharacterized protein YciI
VKYVVLYEPAEDIAVKAPPHFPAHRAWYEDFHARGLLLMIGTFADAQTEGAMGIFTSHEAAEEFVGGDPFVLNGAVRNWSIRGWNEVLVR